MLRMGIGQAEGLDTGYLTRKALARAKSDLGPHRPIAALVLAGAEYDHPVMLREILNRYPDIALTGCTTAGEFSSNLGFTEFSINILLFASDTVEISAGLGMGVSASPGAAARQALETARKSLHTNETLCLVFPDGTSKGGADIVSTLNGELVPGCPQFGAASARHGTMNGRPKQFLQDLVVEDGVALLLFAGPLRYAGSISNSWEPLGQKDVVTSARGRDVIRIGEKSALDFYAHYLGEHIRPVFAFPLAVYDESGERFYLRSPIGYDEKTGAVTFGSPVPLGATVQLTEARTAHILAETVRSVDEVCREFGGAPEAALVFSCNARKIILGSRTARELEIMKDKLPPNTPVLGFYGYAEFGPLRREEGCLLHHATMVTLLLGEQGRWAMPHGSPAPAEKEPYGASPLDSVVQERDLLLRKLRIADYYRDHLEVGGEASASLLRQVNREIIETREALSKEKEKSDRLLRSILPDAVAQELKEKGVVEPVFYRSATVLFTDFVGFTRIASEMSPQDLVRELDVHFTVFDRIIGRHGLEKLKTIGDSYMCAGGVPRHHPEHAQKVVRAAWDMRLHMEKVRREREEKGLPVWAMRIGVHTGAIVAGVIGTEKFSYDVWGDAVNIASRLESCGTAGEINISAETYAAVRGEFDCEPRGLVEVKGKGGLEMYFVRGKRG